MKREIVICRPAYEVELFGGPESVRVGVGSLVRVHPADDLFVRGAKCAEIRVISKDGETVKVRPYVGGSPVRGKLHTLAVRNILVDEKGVGT